jgi:alpha-acetolactate decarboxylase
VSENVPQVTARPVGQNNGDVVTEFTNVADTGATVWSYPAPQNEIIFHNDGVQLITLTVNGTAYPVNPQDTVTVKAQFTSFTVQSAAQSQEFDARTTNTSGRDRAFNDANGLTANTNSYTYLSDGSVGTSTTKDAAGNVISVTTFTYKANGDVNTSVKVMNGQTVTTQYIYDANGNLTDTVSTKV